MLEFYIKKLNNNSIIPKAATEGSAGMDLFSNIPNKVIIPPTKRAVIPVGIAIEIPKEYEAQVRSRSGLAAKHGIMVLNSPGTIDSDYRGEIKVILMNLGEKAFTVSNNMKIAQLIITRYEAISWIESNELSDTKRSVGGFGSTGV